MPSRKRDEQQQPEAADQAADVQPGEIDDPEAYRHAIERGDIAPLAGAPQPASAVAPSPDPAADAGDEPGGDEVAETVAAEQECGFRGTDVDPTPNANYTVRGVTSGAPTPETDADAARTAREARNV